MVPKNVPKNRRRFGSQFKADFTEIYNHLKGIAQSADNLSGYSQGTISLGEDRT